MCSRYGVGRVLWDAIIGARDAGFWVSYEKKITGLRARRRAASAPALRLSSRANYRGERLWKLHTYSIIAC